jgi:hypothetical protein
VAVIWLRSTLAALAALLLLLGAAAPNSSRAESIGPDGEVYYFYGRRDYGSEAMIHPLRLILNGGYGILQLDNRDQSPFDIDYRRGLEVVWNNISDPVSAIEDDGWGEFVKRELLPFSIDSKGGQYWPNYMNHLIGGGMSYRMMAEWYRWHRWPKPKAWAGATIFFYHLLNEVVENQDVEKWTTDPVADLLIFDPLSIVLFSSDRVAGFFSNKLNMNDWSYPFAYDVDQERWVNNGQNFSMKVDLPWFEKWRFFYHFGTHAEVGLSYRLPNGDELSAGAGLIAKNLVPSDGNFRTVDLARSAGLWWDRGGSLLASIDWSQRKGSRLRANVYPGILKIGSFSPGLFGILQRDDRVIFGLAVSWWPIGVGSRF